MEGTTITIDLENVLGGDEDGVSLRHAIIAECSRRLLNDDPTIRDVVRRQAEHLADDELRPRFAALLEQALDRVIQPATKWGEPDGDPLTFREAIVARVEKYLTETPSDMNSNRSGQRLTRVAAYIQTEVKKAVEADLKDAMDEARDQVKAAVKDSAADVITQTISRMVVRG